MSGDGDLVGKSYQQLYSGYYQNNALLKREISAAQTVECMAGTLSGLSIDKLIDVGAGEGSVLLEVSRRTIARELYALEISESGVEAIRSKQIPRLSSAQLFDGYRIPFPDKFFDLAIAIHVLEHVEHERLFLREMRRVSRRAYIEVPLEHGFKVRRAIAAGRKYGHINFYTRDTLRSLLESSGLKVTRTQVFASSLRYEQCLNGPVRGRIKNVARKTALAVAPDLAPLFLAYNGYALCECD